MVSATQTPARVRPGYQPLVIVLAAVSIGILLDRITGVRWSAWWLTAVAAWCAWWLLWRRGCDRAALLLLLASLAAIAGAWHHTGWHLFAADEIGLYAREDFGPMAIEAVALRGARTVPAPPRDPLRAIPIGERSRLEVQVVAIRDGARWRAASGSATLLVDGRLTGIGTGDRVRAFGQFGRIRTPDNPGEFDMARHARADRRLCLLRADFPQCVTRLASGRWQLASAIDFLRAEGDRLLWRHLDAQRAGLAAAMFLGLRDELDPDQSRAFLETGTVHLLVVSGLNVGILAGCLFLAARCGLLGRSAALVVVAVVTVLYAMVTDLQPPVVRSTAMVLAVCAAFVWGRRTLALNSLAAAALVVLVMNPAELFRTGTQLSFLSVAALAWVAEHTPRDVPLDPLDRLIARSRPWPARWMRSARRSARTAIVASTIVWVVVAPLVAAQFHLLAFSAVVLGPLLAVPVALSMAAGFGVFFVGALLPAVAGVLGWICDVNLAILARSVDVARDLPGSYRWVCGPTGWWLAIFYAGLASWLFVPQMRPPRRWRVALLSAWLAVGLVAAWLPRRDRERLDCTFVSVGHGCCVVLELPGGKTVLYDAGRLGSPATAAHSIAAVLWTRGITHLDAVVLSHADVDHYNALPELLRQFSVGAVYVSPVMFERSTRALDALAGAIRRAGVPLREIWAGDLLRSVDLCRIEVLHPPRHGVLGSDNANSVVLAVEYQRRRLLLTGDLESPGLNDLLAELPLDCDVVLAPHHGSGGSDPPGMARWSTPEWVVISGGPRDRVASVARAYAARGSHVLHTAEQGAVQVAVDRGQLLVQHWRGDRFQAIGRSECDAGPNVAEALGNRPLRDDVLDDGVPDHDVGDHDVGHDDVGRRAGTSAAPAEETTTD